MEYLKNQLISKRRLLNIQKFLKNLNLNKNKNFERLSKDPDFLSIINEALIHTSAKEKINYERLEFLGDAVLRLAASEYIENNFPLMKVGDRSALRAQLVSDKWLTKVGINIGIHEILIVGPKAAKDPFALETLQAEATEALIGAIYECMNDLDMIHNWLTPFWEKETSYVLNDPYKQNPKSALQEWTQGNGFKLPEYLYLEKSKKHGDPKRFVCEVKINGKSLAKGFGKSIQDSEKEAAKIALKKIDSI